MKFRPVEPNLADELDLVLLYRNLVRLYPDVILESPVVSRIERAVARYQFLDRHAPLRSNPAYIGVENARDEIFTRVLTAPDSAYDFNDKDVVATLLEHMIHLADRISQGKYKDEITEQYLQDRRRAIGKLPLFRQHRRIRKLYLEIAFRLNQAYEVVRNRHQSQVSAGSLEEKVEAIKTA